jgi:hypothetical protein
MKTEIFFSTLLAQPIFGDLARIEAMIAEWSANATASGQFGSGANGPQSRGQLLPSGSYIRSVDNYGCFCYFDENHTKGAGIPKNEIDERCLALHQGYSCAKIDGDCDEPWNANYQVSSHIYVNMYTTSIAPEQLAVDGCNGVGNSDCELRACITEVNFAVMMLRDNTVSFGTFDSSLKHSEGFAPATECPKKAPVVGSVSCCGDYPNRAPFKSSSNTFSRDCCGGTVYDTDMYCCASNTVQIIGTCSP